MSETLYDQARTEARIDVFDEYAMWTERVAQYPPSAEPFYLALGIADEYGELIREVMAHIPPGQYSNNYRIASECGDVMWYCARYCVRVLHIPFHVAIDFARNHEFVTESYSSVAVGVICGVEKKRIRDGALWDDEKRREKHSAAFGALVKVLRYLETQAINANTTLEAVIINNREKLEERLAKDAVRGDGEDR